VNTTISIVVVIVVAIFSSVTAPLILSHQTEKIRSRDRREDYRRQDEVAARAAEAATLLAENNKLVAQSSGAISGQLSQIHTLVNSNMTAAMESEYEAVGRELAMMLEVIELRRAQGQQPTTQALAAVETTRAKRAELASLLEDRAHAQARNDAEEAARKEAG